ncbi:MAG: GntR family transcriptional regulator [Phycisphaerales bacterium JB043]
MTMQPPFSTLRESIREEIISRVISGSLTPGDRIKESNLAHELGVSSTPVREAMISLEHSGFVLSVPRKGFVIAPFDPQEVRNLASAICILESAALRLCDSVDKDHLDELRKLNSEFRLAGEDMPLALDLDYRWHSLLLAPCPNRYLLQLIESTQQSLRRYNRFHQKGKLNIERSASEHESVIDAIERNDVNVALRHLDRNWQISTELLVTKLESNEELESARL